MHSRRKGRDTKMASPIEFHICIFEGKYEIGAIMIKIDNKFTSDEFGLLLAFLETDTEHFVLDVNSCGLGTTAYDRVAQRAQDLANILPDAKVDMDLNLAHYGLNVEYDEDAHIPYPLSDPVLVVNVYGNEYKRVHTDDFKTVLYDCLVDCNG
jgi:hypothetical protein